PGTRGRRPGVARRRTPGRAVVLPAPPPRLLTVGPRPATTPGVLAVGPPHTATRVLTTLPPRTATQVFTALPPRTATGVLTTRPSRAAAPGVLTVRACRVAAPAPWVVAVRAGPVAAGPWAAHGVAGPLGGAARALVASRRAPPEPVTVLTAGRGPPASGITPVAPPRAVVRVPGTTAVAVGLTPGTPTTTVAVVS
ncbi:hypothetical protein AB0I15_31435, partial [Nonomuraea sp. NPDC050643]